MESWCADNMEGESVSKVEVMVGDEITLLKVGKGELVMEAGGLRTSPSEIAEGTTDVALI